MTKKNEQKTSSKEDIFSSITLDGFADFRDADEKLSELRRELCEVEQELRECVSKTGTKAVDSVTAEAAALIRGETVSMKIKDHGELEKRRKVLMKAIQLQEQEVRRIRMKRSQEICDDVIAPILQALLREMAHKAADLSKQCATLRRIWEICEERDIHRCFPSLVLNRIGDLSDSSSGVCYFLRDCVEHGYITNDEHQNILSK